MKREGLLDLNEAVQHPGKKLTFAIVTRLDQEADIDLLDPVSGELQAVSTGNLLLLDSKFSTRAVSECARCGAPIDCEVSFVMSDQFQVEGVPASYSRDGYARVVTDEPEPMFNENALIVDNYVRQGLLINLPAQPLCSGSWDVPCPEGRPDTVQTEPTVHPALKGLASLKTEDDE
ncbi:MAG: DUF177 domain-containing protein [Armatimonadetes bacterium]|nr:DUF177 domain-containing protein [Armatimonadota bacterium]